MYEFQAAARLINSEITREHLGLRQRCESLCQILGLQIIRKLNPLNTELNPICQ